MAQPLTPAFAARGLRLRLGATEVLRGLDFELRPDEPTALVGPSGAGKTSLLRLLGTALRPTGGELYVRERDVRALSAAELRELRSRIGFVHQDLTLVPGYSAASNVGLGRIGRRGFWSAVRTLLAPGQGERLEILELLERVGLAERYHAPVEQLSGGEAQRTAIARALFQEPHTLLCDEPLAAVDPTRSRDLLELLLGLARERGLTLVCSLHNLELAREFFPRLIGLRDGAIAYDGPPADLSSAAADALYAF